MGTIVTCFAGSVRSFLAPFSALSVSRSGYQARENTAGGPTVSLKPAQALPPELQDDAGSKLWTVGSRTCCLGEGCLALLDLLVEQDLQVAHVELGVDSEPACEDGHRGDAHAHGVRDLACALPLLTLA